MKVYLSFITILALTSFSYSQEQGMGMVFNDEIYSQALLLGRNTSEVYESVPDNHSMKEYCPKPLNQMQFGTCVGWSTAYGARTIMEAIKYGWTNQDTITHNAFSPSFAYGLVKKEFDTKCSFGANIGEVLLAMKILGNVKYRDYPYLCPDNVDFSRFSNARDNKIDDYLRLFKQADTDEFKLSVMKLALSNNHPVIIGMKAPPSLFDAKEIWIPQENPKEVVEGHSVVAVSYDDTKFGGAFEIMNSWGTRWGNDGFTWIKYSDFLDFTWYAYEIWEIPDESNIEGSISLKYREVIERSYKKITPGYYKQIQAAKSGDAFNILISNNNPAYIYGFVTDLNKDVYPIFPESNSTVPLLNNSRNQVAWPGQYIFLEFDETKGKDFIIVFFSKQELDFEQILEDIKNGWKETDDFQQFILAYLRNFLIDWDNIEYSENEVSFKAKFSDRSLLVPLIFEFEHR